MEKAEIKTIPLTKYCNICRKHISRSMFQRHTDAHCWIQRLGIRCQWCNSINLVKDGFAGRGDKRLQTLMCRDCGRSTTVNATRSRKEKRTANYIIIAKLLRVKEGKTYKEIKKYFKDRFRLDIDEKTAWAWVNSPFYNDLLYC